jgi:excinuclease ABC subunit B
MKDVKHIPKTDIPSMIINLEGEMKKEADALNFERAIELREKIRRLKKQEQDK